MNCPVTLTSIETACGANMAGVKEIWLGNFGAYSFTYDYQVSPDFEGDTPSESDYVKINGEKVKKNIATATLNSGATVMTHFGFRKQTASATNTLTVNDNGTNYWENAISLVFAKQDEEKRLAIMAIMQGATCAIVKDNNDNLWFYGLENELTMSEGTVETGTSYSDTNAYNVTLSTSETILPLPVSSAAFTTLTVASN